jgi:hypothetical protein
VWALPVGMFDEDVVHLEIVGEVSRVPTGKSTLWTMVILKKQIHNKFTSFCEIQLFVFIVVTEILEFTFVSG